MSLPQPRVRASPRAPRARRLADDDDDAQKKESRSSLRSCLLFGALMVVVVLAANLFLGEMEITVNTRTLSMEVKSDGNSSLGGVEDVQMASKNLFQKATEAISKQTNGFKSTFTVEPTAIGDMGLNQVLNLLDQEPTSTRTATSDEQDTPSVSFYDQMILDEQSSSEVKNSAITPKPVSSTTAGSVLVPSQGRNTAATSKTIPSTAAGSMLVPSQEPGFKKHPSQLSEKYVSRAKPIDGASEKLALTKKWGSWAFSDPKADQRPTDDFYALFPSRDVSHDQFPANSWQTDKEYLSKFLPEAEALLERSLEAILAEYGHSKFDEPEKSFEERSEMFSLKMMDLGEMSAFNFKIATRKLDNGGWTTERSFQGLVRRALHSIMTEDTFTLVMGGHSAAAGHGNHFQQSYTHQYQKIMEPIFARLGVTSRAHNMAMGGLGTKQSALGSKSIYGDDVDILLWDSSMTEKSGSDKARFALQGLLGGDRVPVLWSHLNHMLHEEADVDYGNVAMSWNPGFGGMNVTSDPETLEKNPWAARCMPGHVGGEMKAICRQVEYSGRCWVDRDDFTPKKEQNKKLGGQVKWHAGFKHHQVRGRILAFNVIRALQEGIKQWAQAENYVLPDDAWHVHSYYENIRNKVKGEDTNAVQACKMEETLPERVCTTPLNARTEYTPRRNPAETSIRSILKFPDQVGPVPPNAYDPPDVRNPDLEVPDGVFDVLSVVENGNDYVASRARKEIAAKESMTFKSVASSILSKNEAIVPGKGYKLYAMAASDNCDGSFDSFCGRDEDSSCLLYGHNDKRGSIKFDGLSGWLILNLDHVKEGLILAKIDAWLASNENPATEGWVCENGATRCVAASKRNLRSSAISSALAVASDGEQDLAFTEAMMEGSEQSARRRLKTKRPPPEFCDDFRFEIAIDGKITSRTKEEWVSGDYQTLLDDPSFSGTNVEVAIRVTGCARQKTFQLTHIYWA